MADKFGKDVRSKIMRQIKDRDTIPEMRVRSFLHRMGFRFRLHARNLPGKPDIVLPKYRAVIFVHGCFWHQHPGCKHSHIPKSNKGYWKPKLERNVKRDIKHRQELRELGWKVIVIWECEIDEGGLASLPRALREKKRS